LTKQLELEAICDLDDAINPARSHGHHCRRSCSRPLHQSEPFPK
jgi:hypothetical protein